MQHQRRMIIRIKGLQETVRGKLVSTREVRVVRRNVSDTRRITRSSSSTVTVQRDQGGGGDGGGGPPDPLAQSFIIDQADGCYITSVDCFFSTKSDTIPVRAEIRRMKMVILRMMYYHSFKNI